MFTQDEFGHFGPRMPVRGALRPRKIQYLDVKEINDLCADYEARIIALMSAHRACCTPGEGKAIRKEIYDLWERYIRASDEAKEMSDRYMRQLGMRGGTKGFF